MVVEGSEGEREKRVDFAVVTGLDFQAALWQKGLTLLMPERSGPPKNSLAQPYFMIGRKLSPLIPFWPTLIVLINGVQFDALPRLKALEDSFVPVIQYPGN